MRTEKRPSNLAIKRSLVIWTEQFTLNDDVRSQILRELGKTSKEGKWQKVVDYFLKELSHKREDRYGTIASRDGWIK